ncbi:MAG: single-stranded-DNA-specific exonuclease RecJ [Alphaproteobacteria bacterium]
MSGEVILDIKKSARSRTWRSRAGRPDFAQQLAREFDLPDAVASVLAARTTSVEAASEFLTPRLRDQLPDPSHLLDMGIAVDRVAEALVTQERIAIFADYDVDGATSGALLTRVFRSLDVEPILYVPDREREGYGPNPEAMAKLAAAGATLLITVDCGATAFDAIDAANQNGMDVVVLDHHMGAADTPNALAVVNPNRADETSAHGQLAAVGVCFLFVIALRRRLKEEQIEVSFDPLALLDLAALGTVADVASLTGVNRALVAQGLKVMAGRKNLGVDALLEVGAIATAPEARHLGFALGPRINAGGRIGESDLGLRLLSTEDAGEARDIAGRLDALNRERQEIERAVLDAATPMAEDQADNPIIAVAGEGWRQGVVGIVASRLAERFGRPALVAAIDGDIAVGSARSVPGVALGPAVIALREEGLLIAGGGHEMAAGFKVAAEGFRQFHEALAERLAPEIAIAGQTRVLEIDGLVGPAGAYAAASALDRLAPFGAGNPEPRFAMPGLRLKHVDIIKDAHLRLRLEGGDGAKIDAMAFRVADRPLGQFLIDAVGKVIHVAGRIEIDTWRGRDSARMIVEDAAPAN